MSFFKEDNGIPLYYQLKELIREKINEGIWKSGDKIPNELDLAETYDVSRATVRQAILSLVNEGLLFRKRGKGTFVSKPKLESDFINFHFPKTWGSKHELISVQEINCPLSVCKYLEVNPEERIYEIVRIRIFEEDPVALEKSYVRKKLVPNFLSQNFDGILSELLFNEYNIEIAKTKSFIDPILLDEYEAAFLKVKTPAPALKLTRIGLNQNNESIIFSTSIIRGDRCRMIFKNQEDI